MVQARPKQFNINQYSSRFKKKKVVVMSNEIVTETAKEATSLRWELNEVLKRYGVPFGKTGVTIRDLEGKV
jgi:hypothetical protein